MDTTAARPVAYIRRSVVSRSAPGDISKEFQTEEVRRLAGDDGAALDIIATDWGRSGSRAKADQRDGFLAMLADIEAGRVTKVLAYATDRLARDVELAARLLNACERAGTTIIVKGSVFPPGDRAARQSFHLQALMNEDFSSQAAEKAASTVGVRVRRGDKMGSPPYGWRIAPRVKGEAVTWEPDPSEDVDAVLAAYREAGSFHGAARRLNDAGVAAPRGSHWYGSRVRDILKAQRGDVSEVRRTTPRVAFRPDSAAIFRRLLRCHCDGTPTPTRQRSGAYSYRCPKGHTDRTDHPAVQVSEAVLIEWSKEEAARLRGIDPEYDGAANEARRAELLSRREGLAEAVELRLIERAAAIVKRDAIDAELDRLDGAVVIEAVQAIDWTWPPEALHVGLRALWEYIELDRDMRPVRAEWRVKEWRA